MRIIRGLAFVALLVLLTSRCANVGGQGPGGGPKDTLSPVLLRTLPAFYATDQHPKRIYLQFDEYVQVKEASKNVVLSPPAVMRPEVRRRGKGVEVVFADSLLPNTTYTIDFGASVFDLNESNPFPPFCYVFSTGPVIDSMKLTGKVLNAYDKEPVPAMTVGLYENTSDTAIYKTMPVKVARTDAWGYFSLQNIKPVDYHLVAFVDKNNNFMYDPGTEMLAFVDSTVRPQKVISDYRQLLTAINPKDTAALLARPYEWELNAFTENAGKQFLKEQQLTGKRQISLIFNRQHAVVDTFLLNGVDTADMVLEHSRFNDTLIYWVTAPAVPDTLSVTINYLKTDSLGQLSPFSAKLKLQPAKPEEQEKKKKKEDDEEEEKPVLVPAIEYTSAAIGRQGLRLRFSALLKQADWSKVLLFKIDGKDKTKKTPEKYTLKADSLRLRQFYLQANFQAATDYELVLQQGAFTDIYALANDSIVKAINVEDPDKYSSIKLNITGIAAGEQIIMQLMDEKKKTVLREELLSVNGSFQVNYLKAGKFALRFIRDDNKNGIWDPGSYKERRQSESADFFTLPDNSEIIELRENTELLQQVNVTTVLTRQRKAALPEDIHPHEPEPIGADHDHAPGVLPGVHDHNHDE